MTLPSFAPFPPSAIRLSLGAQEWESCLDAWLTLSELMLRLPSADLQQNASLSAFLSAFYHELADHGKGDSSLSMSKCMELRRATFKLAGRLLVDREAQPTLISWDFLGNFCVAHMQTSALSKVMTNVWRSHTVSLAATLQKQKDVLTLALESKALAGVATPLSRLAAVMLASADIGAFFTTGSDFLDALVGAYNKCSDDEQRKAISSVTYLSLISCVRTDTPNFSLLSDHLYTLKSQADKFGPSHSLLADLITNSPLVPHVRRSINTKAPDRLFKLLDTLETYRSTAVSRPKKHVQKTRSKGKGRQRQPDPELHLHRMSLVTQVQDLFPDLGAGFVLKLLDEYGDDVEQATAHLLDDQLPAHLACLDRSELAPIYDVDQQTAVDRLAPRSTPPPPELFIPERRNVFDNDDLDRLSFDAKRLHIGKQDKNEDGEQPNKAAILSALAAFDSDDDERDDTYDVEDVGGTVDTAHPDGEPGPAVKVTFKENEMALFTTYKSSPELFGRTFDVRRGQARQALKAETGMTDEAIEGWAIMLQRDPKRLKRLEAQVGAFDGRQTELASTSYRESAGETETEDSDGPQQIRGGFRGRVRGGRGRGRGGRGGGNVAGSSSDPSTAQAQRRKEANKGRRANHNRRDQRARKIARAGFPG